MPENEIAARLRDIARAYEQSNGFIARGPGHVACQYSCNAVFYEFGQSSEMRRRYAAPFELSEGNDWQLWHHENGVRRYVRERNDLRILMLCFAAAMAETGDL